MGDLRTRQRALGRQAIVDACAALVTERHLLDFTMKEVAERAGVSLRTVYNHFATREDMLDALGDVIAQQTQALGQKEAADLANLDDFYEAITTNMSIFDQLGGISEAFAQMPLANVGGDRERAARTKLLTEFLAHQMPSAPPEDATAIAIVLRHLASHRSWFWLTREYGLDTHEVARVVNWATETLLDAAENGRGPRPGPQNSQPENNTSQDNTPQENKGDT